MQIGRFMSLIKKYLIAVFILPFIVLILYFF